MKYLFLILSLIIISAFQSQIQAKTLYEKIDSIMDDYYPKDKPGASLIIIKRGVVLFEKGYGLANIEYHEKISSSHVFRVASMTKQFTSVGVLMLAEEGKISLQDNVVDYLPFYPKSGEQITIENLLTHTSGIPNYTVGSKWRELRKMNLLPLDIIELFMNKPLLFPPGEKYDYSNSGYILLGAIIEKVSGMKYEQFMKTRIFDVLEMSSSYYVNEDGIKAPKTSGYVKRGNKFINAPFTNMTIPYSAGALSTTVKDLGKWYKALHASKLITKQSISKAWKSFKLNSGKLSYYGYGWGISDLQGEETVEHGGRISGFLSHAIYFPKKDILVAILSNNYSNFPSRKATEIATLVIDKPFKKVNVIDLDSKRLAEYVGSYRFESNNIRNILYENGTIFSQTTNAKKMQLLPISKDHFLIMGSYAELIFERNRNGHIKGVYSKKDVHHGSYALKVN